METIQTKARRCPVCEKEQLHGYVCDNCGFDLSCDYEGHRTLCSVLPKDAEPISAHAAKWKQQQQKQQVIAVSPADLMCPKCGGKHFWFQIDELQFLCTDCKTEIPLVIQRGRSADAAPAALVLPVDGIDPRAKQETEGIIPPSAVVGSRKKQTPLFARPAGPTIAAGEIHTVGLKADGTVVAAHKYPFDGSDLSEVKGWKDIVAFAAGRGHTVGLKADGTVVAARKSNNLFDRNSPSKVKGWRDIVAIAAGTFHTVGLKSDGTVVAVGWNSFGECNVSGWTNIVAIDAGAYHTVGLKSNGTVVAVGENRYGQCDVDGWTDILVPDRSN